MMLQDVVQSVNVAEGDEVVWSAVTAWATAKLIEWAKTKSWVPMSTDTARLNRIVSWLIGAFIGLGFTVTFDGDHFAVSGSISAIVSGGAHVMRQIMFGEIAYDKFVKKGA